MSISHDTSMPCCLMGIRDCPTIILFADVTEDIESLLFMVSFMSTEEVYVMRFLPSPCLESWCSCLIVGSSVPEPKELC